MKNHIQEQEQYRSATILKIEAFKRPDAKFDTAFKLRSNGFVPGVIYGKKKNNLNIFLDAGLLQKVTSKIDFFTQKIELNIQGDKYIVFPKKIEKHPVNDKIIHIDFIFGDSKEIVLDVPIIYNKIQDIAAIKQGGFFNILIRSIRIACSTNEPVQKICLNLPSMQRFRILKISDLKKLFPKFKILEKEQKVIASIVSKKNILEEEEDEKVKTQYEDTAK